MLTEKQRKETLKRAYGAIREGGYLILSLRTARDIRRYVEPKGMPFRDGFIMKKTMTFVRPYKREEVIEALTFLDLKIIKIYRSSESYVAIS